MRKITTLSLHLLILLLLTIGCNQRQTEPDQPEPVMVTNRTLSATTTGNRILIPKNHDSGWYKPSLTNVHPGDTIVAIGDYAYWNFDGLNGTADNPIVIINSGHCNVGINNSYSIVFTNSSYFIMDGSQNPGDRYGFTVGNKVTSPQVYTAQGLTVGNSTNYEIKNVEVTRTQVGVFGNPATGRNMFDIKIHDIWVHDLDNPTEGGRTEAFYLGNTSNTTIAQTHFSNIEIYNVLGENLSGDGIQLADAQGYNIHDCTIRNFGKANLDDQHTGILIGGNSYGSVKNCFIESGTGSGMEIFGYSYNLVQGCSIKYTATSTNQPDAVYIARKDATDTPLPLQVDMINNIIDGANRYGINNTNNSTNGKSGTWSGNTVVNCRTASYYTTIDSIDNNPPPPPPPPINDSNQVSVTWNASTGKYIVNWNVSYSSVKILTVQTSTDGVSFKNIDFTASTDWTENKSGTWLSSKGSTPAKLYVRNLVLLNNGRWEWSIVKSAVKA